MRTLDSSPPDVIKRPSDLIPETRRYKVITPLYGGGVKPGEADPITVVRASEVRGHLRFWWRATRGGQFNGNLEAMKRREEEVWGSAAAEGRPGPSRLTIEVQAHRRGSDLKTVNENPIGDPRSPYSYVAFPLRAEEGKPAGKVVQDVEFGITLRYPAADKAEVAAALWAWQTFGGIGARTRRGFGALQCVEIDGSAVTPPTVATIQNVVQEGLNDHVVKGTWPKDVPHLIKEFRISPREGTGDPMMAWKHLFDKLKHFRQARFNDSRGKPFGRSKWPEADAIRHITGESAQKHAQRRLTFDKFPRARFGLPIIFQFKDTNLKPPDPDPTTLQGREHDRLASPLILRPLACAGERAVGLAAILDAPTRPPGGWLLKGPYGEFNVEASLTSGEAPDIEPLRAAKGGTDVLQAFLNTL